MSASNHRLTASNLRRLQHQLVDTQAWSCTRPRILSLSEQGTAGSVDLEGIVDDRNGSNMGTRQLGEPSEPTTPASSEGATCQDKESETKQFQLCDSAASIKQPSSWSLITYLNQEHREESWSPANRRKEFRFTADNYGKREAALREKQEKIIEELIGRRTSSGNC